MNPIVAPAFTPSHLAYPHVDSRRSFQAHWFASVGAWLIVAASALLGSCGYAGNPPVTKPGVVTILVTPISANVAAGVSQQFQATITGTTNTSVTWEVNGVTGGTSSTGAISANGLYTAPATLPSAPSVTITAVSVADPQASATAAINFENVISISLSPSSATVSLGGAQVFGVTITGISGASANVTWSVNGVAGGNATVGTISSNSSQSAVYTAPASMPAQNAITITATIVADSSKSASATVTLACGQSNSISPSSASVALGQAQTFSANLCSSSGAQIGWDVNGVSGGNASLGTIAATSANSANYIAPSSLPSSNPVTIHAVSGAATASAAVTVFSQIAVQLTPTSATLVPSQSLIFTPNVTGTTNTNVTWTVSGFANGNSSVGFICQPSSSPCLPPASPTSGDVSYLAPASAPANPVTITAISQADPSRTASAQVQISGAAGNTSIIITPAYAFMPPTTNGNASKQPFYARTSEPAGAVPVNWTVASTVAGQSCSPTACGSIDANGIYTAPSSAPSPNAIAVVATNQADAAITASAIVAVTSGPTIRTILPSSVAAGAVEGFPLEVEGVNFIAGAGSSASIILINGVPHGTTCPSATACSTAVNPVDVAAESTLTIQIQNPAPSFALSNPVPFVIVPFATSVRSIPLSAPQSSAPQIKFTVAEPATAASAAPLNVDLIGYLDGGNNCGIGAAPLAITRPSSGTSTGSICVHGNNLDALDVYAFSGAGGAPNGGEAGDITVTASPVTGLFPNIIELDLQISSTTLPGVRTLFITTPNGDRAAATGMLEIK